MVKCLLALHMYHHHPDPMISITLLHTKTEFSSVLVLFGYSCVIYTHTQVSFIGIWKELHSSYRMPSTPYHVVCWTECCCVDFHTGVVLLLWCCKVRHSLKEFQSLSSSPSLLCGCCYQTFFVPYYNIWSASHLQVFC